MCHCKELLHVVKFSPNFLDDLISSFSEGYKLLLKRDVFFSLINSIFGRSRDQVEILFSVCLRNSEKIGHLRRGGAVGQNEIGAKNTPVLAANAGCRMRITLVEPSLLLL